MREIQAGQPEAPLRAFIVWLPMLRTDSEEAAAGVARSSTESRIRHFYDPSAASGRAVAALLGGSGYVAWDVYLVYAPGVRWSDGPPAPVAWFHQLHGSFWADEGHHRTGPDLDVALRSAVDDVLATAGRDPGGER